MDVEAHLESLERWKADGRIRCVGITTSSERRYDDVAEHLEREADRHDPLQINYSPAERILSRPGRWNSTARRGARSS